MRVLIIKEFVYWHPEKRYFAKFERMKTYNLPEVYSNWLIENKYAIPFNMVDELKSELEFRGKIQ